METSGFGFENSVFRWWLFLCFLSLVNLWLWTQAYRFRAVGGPRRSAAGSRELLNEEKLVWLSLAYVIGCALRSIWPKADVARSCLFDTWFSSVFFGRGVATVAELAFVAQWVILLRLLGEKSGSAMSRKISCLLLPLIVLAEGFSWAAVITTNYLGNTCEESLWGISYVLVTVALMDLFRRLRGRARLLLTLGLFGCIAYVAFMFFVDVPMYFHRWRVDESNHKIYLGLWEGLKDLNTRWIITHDIRDWREEIPWLTLYFSVAVWTSIGFCYITALESWKNLGGPASME